MGLGDGTGALQDLAELDELFDQLSQSYANRGMDGSALSLIDLDKLPRQLGAAAAVDARNLAELEKALRETGYLQNAPPGNYRSPPQPTRQLCKTSPKEVTNRIPRDQTPTARRQPQP